MMTIPASRSHDITSGGRCALGSMDTKMPRMNWDRISGNWTQWKGRVLERWGKLTSDQLDVIAGRRDQLSGRIQEAYGLTREDAERQLRNWERNLAVDYEEADLVVDDEDRNSTHRNGRE
jgi:uncharacterized protein YjbJ (UPF0337 family)